MPATTGSPPRARKLVVDTNCLISALLRPRSEAYHAFVRTRHVLYTPKYAIAELLAHLPLIEAETQLDHTELLRRLLHLTLKLRVVDPRRYRGTLASAKRATKHVDPTDSPFLALLHALKAYGIVSYDAHYDRLGVRRLQPRDLL